MDENARFSSSCAPAYPYAQFLSTTAVLAAPSFPSIEHPQTSMYSQCVPWSPVEPTPTQPSSYCFTTQPRNETHSCLHNPTHNTQTTKIPLVSGAQPGFVCQTPGNFPSSPWSLPLNLSLQQPPDACFRGIYPGFPCSTVDGESSFTGSVPPSNAFWNIHNSHYGGQYAAHANNTTLHSPFVAFPRFSSPGHEPQICGRFPRAPVIPENGMPFFVRPDAPHETPCHAGVPQQSKICCHEGSETTHTERAGRRKQRHSEKKTSRRRHKTERSLLDGGLFGPSPQKCSVSHHSVSQIGSCVSQNELPLAQSLTPQGCGSHQHCNKMHPSDPFHCSSQYPTHANDVSLHCVDQSDHNLMTPMRQHHAQDCHPPYNQQLFMPLAPLGSRETYNFAPPTGSWDFRSLPSHGGKQAEVFGFSPSAYCSQSPSNPQQLQHFKRDELPNKRTADPEKPLVAQTWSPPSTSPVASTYESFSSVSQDPGITLAPPSLLKTDSSNGQQSCHEVCCKAQCYASCRKQEPQQSNTLLHDHVQCCEHHSADYEAHKTMAYTVAPLYYNAYQPSLTERSRQTYFANNFSDLPSHLKSSSTAHLLAASSSTPPPVPSTLQSLWPMQPSSSSLHCSVSSVTSDGEALYQMQNARCGTDHSIPSKCFPSQSFGKPLHLMTSRITTRSTADDVSHDDACSLRSTSNHTLPKGQRSQTNSEVRTPRQSLKPKRSLRAPYNARPLRSPVKLVTQNESQTTPALSPQRSLSTKKPAKPRQQRTQSKTTEDFETRSASSSSSCRSSRPTTLGLFGTCTFQSKRSVSPRNRNTKMSSVALYARSYSGTVTDDAEKPWEQTLRCHTPSSRNQRAARPTAKAKRTSVSPSLTPRTSNRQPACSDQTRRVKIETTKPDSATAFPSMTQANILHCKHHDQENIACFETSCPRISSSPLFASNQLYSDEHQDQTLQPAVANSSTALPLHPHYQPNTTNTEESSDVALPTAEKQRSEMTEHNERYYRLVSFDEGFSSPTVAFAIQEESQNTNYQHSANQAAFGEHEPTFSQTHPKLRLPETDMSNPETTFHSLQRTVPPASSHLDESVVSRSYSSFAKLPTQRSISPFPIPKDVLKDKTEHFRACSSTLEPSHTSFDWSGRESCCSAKKTDEERLDATHLWTPADSQQICSPISITQKPSTPMASYDITSSVDQISGRPTEDTLQKTNNATRESNALPFYDTTSHDGETKTATDVNIPQGKPSVPETGSNDKKAAPKLNWISQAFHSLLPAKQPTRQVMRRSASTAGLQGLPKPLKTGHYEIIPIGPLHAEAAKSAALATGRGIPLPWSNHEISQSKNAAPLFQRRRTLSEGFPFQSPKNCVIT